ncbi:MAG: hypothetical protein MUC62_05380 [Candidatus Thermoplasmatota archaeon]|nr:hypothetical protein [Candidatus Thermoplasmatota archaeon]
MARRRNIEGEVQAEEEEKKAFKPEEFDELDHMQKENRSAKMLGISLGVAILAGLGSFLIMRLAILIGGGFHLYVPLLSPVLMFALVIYLFSRFGIVIKTLDWKKWLENGAMYTLTWFVIWMLSMNPPFTDLSAPVISKDLVQLDLENQMNISYIDYSGGRKMLIGDETASVGEISPIENMNGLRNISIFVVVTDNWDLRGVDLTLDRLVQGEWKEMTAHPALNITLGSVDDKTSFDPSKKEFKELKKVWSGGSEEVWEKNLYGLRLEVRDPSSSELRDQMDLRLLIRSSDASSNKASHEVLFSIKVS